MKAIPNENREPRTLNNLELLREIVSHAHLEALAHRSRPLDAAVAAAVPYLMTTASIGDLISEARSRAEKECVEVLDRFLAAVDAAALRLCGEWGKEDHQSRYAAAIHSHLRHPDIRDHLSHPLPDPGPRSYPSWIRDACGIPKPQVP